MAVRKILPDTAAGRTHLRVRVASFLRKIRAAMPRAGRPAIREASQHGVIALTFTA
jgi:hypothetical protein